MRGPRVSEVRFYDPGVEEDRSREASVRRPMGWEVEAVCRQLERECLYGLVGSHTYIGGSMNSFLVGLWEGETVDVGRVSTT